MVIGCLGFVLNTFSFIVWKQYKLRIATHYYLMGESQCSRVEISNRSERIIQNFQNKKLALIFFCIKKGNLSIIFSLTFFQIISRSGQRVPTFRPQCWKKNKKQHFDCSILVCNKKFKFSNSFNTIKVIVMTLFKLDVVFAIPNALVSIPKSVFNKMVIILTVILIKIICTGSGQKRRIGFFPNRSHISVKIARISTPLVCM